jgi:hypothetical protein
MAGYVGLTPEQLADRRVIIYTWENFEEEIANEFGAILPRPFCFPGDAFQPHAVDCG